MTTQLASSLMKEFASAIPLRPGSFVIIVFWLGLLTFPTAQALAADSNSISSSLPLHTIREFLDQAHGWGEGRKVRVRGTVTHSISDKTFFIQEGDAATYVFHKPATAFRVGELVEVTGYPSLMRTPTLQRCQARSLGAGAMPTPRVVTVAEALSGAVHMRLVRLQGRLADERLRGGRNLVLSSGDGSNAFTADLESFADLEPFEHLRPGSLLELTGVCSVRRNPDGTPASFNIFIRSPADIVVVKPPSWWTTARVWRVLGIAMLGLTLALAWVLTLRLQVKRQTARILQMNEQLEQRVQERTAELTEANRELEAFTYSVSHDLRAPLRHISGFASIASKNPTVSETPELRKPLENVTTAANRLGRLMDELLQFSRMARQPMKLRIVPLADLVAEVQNELQSEAAGRQIEWRIAPLPEIMGDPATLRIVWLNLLSNAIKYTRKKAAAVIEIDCTWNDREWTFSVRDNGAGFDMRFADRLFGIFQRLHHEDEFEGHGIGLANVRRIINRHGGRIWAEAEVNQGATFRFTLPRRHENAAKSPEQGGPNSPKSEASPPQT